MFVCTACGYLFEDVTTDDELPTECPNCTADPDKFVQYDKGLETWVKKAVAQQIAFPDEDGANLRDPNSSISTHIRFALVGAAKK